MSLYAQSLSQGIDGKQTLLASPNQQGSWTLDFSTRYLGRPMDHSCPGCRSLAKSTGHQDLIQDALQSELQGVVQLSTSLHHQKKGCTGSVEGPQRDGDKSLRINALFAHNGVISAQLDD